ncbi:PAS domain-containing sensor histidine kinase [Rhodopirellula halodulae]|uniref:PAS domain-containing sensor histidine kinase n=1 Tax=Rhodopirellula halodulae TaxID=2894198 RepID=UPI0021BC500C|nr:ATP-binding protein [Rhodopirellula sp. JC740]
MSELELLQRRLAREKAARKSAEQLLEQKSREVYETNEKLIDLAERTKAIVETAAEGIIVYDESGCIETFNRSACELFGREYVVGVQIQDLFEEQSATHDALFPNCMLTSEDDHPLEVSPEDGMCRAHPIELSARRNGGSSFCAEVAISRCVRNGLVLFTMLVRDLSQRKILESRLNQARKMESVGNLAAGIAHEINTPIQFIGDNLLFLQNAFTDLEALFDAYDSFLQTETSSDTVASNLQQIRQRIESADIPFLKEELPTAIQQSIDGIERVAGIVRAMKEFSSPTADCKALVDLNRSIRNAIKVSQNHYQDVAEIETYLDATLNDVHCNAIQINQCILNLLANACEALQHDDLVHLGKITVRTERTEETARVMVNDNGPGIPESILDRIFEPFFTTKEVGQGMGQGLAFVYSVIVDQHGGQIRVSPTPAGGTSVCLELPLSAPSL